jgi:hypothetical protein
MSTVQNTVGGPSPLGAHPPHHRLRIFAPIVAVTLCWSCVDGVTDVSEDTAEREEFIGSYVDLRTAAVNVGSTDIGDDVRDSILTVYGVSEQDLLDFVETHGEDVEFMSALWTEVEARLVASLERALLDEDDGDDGV